MCARTSRDFDRWESEALGSHERFGILSSASVLNEEDCLASSIKNSADIEIPLRYRLHARSQHEFQTTFGGIYQD